MENTNRINKVDVTRDTITGRGGIVLFVHYLESICIYQILEKYFGFLRKSKKGLPIWNLFKQIFCFFFDGSSHHISYFDDLAEDKGYTAAIENSSKEMASSHTIKRFFNLFFWWHGNMFRKILHKLFIWRLHYERPDVIEMTMDGMVMDNDEAQVREGVQPTYKKKKGFHPLQIIWNHKIIDAVFRGGSKHCNYGNVVLNMVTDLVNLIREKYRKDVTIILRIDSGFFDEKNFEGFDKLNIIFIASGKMYNSVKEYAAQTRKEDWGRYKNERQVWGFLEFGYRCDSWSRFYRAIYTRPVYDEKGQGLLDFQRPENVIITNLGLNHEAIEHCDESMKKYLLKTESIIENHHRRGADELPHRGLKDFGSEQLPFKRFGNNSAYYYCMLIAFFLFETFKADVTREIIPMVSYATTFRRKIVDIAAKIVRTSHNIILKVAQTVMDTLHFGTLWKLCQNPPKLIT